MAALVAGKEPGLKGTTKVSKAGGTERLTDTSKYTGRGRRVVTMAAPPPRRVEEGYVLSWVMGAVPSSNCHIVNLYL